MDALRRIKEEVEAKKEEALNKVKEEIEDKKREALKMMKEGKEEALSRVKEELEEKKEKFMKVKEVMEDKKEAILKVKDGVEAMSEEAYRKFKEEVEAQKDEAFDKVREKVEDKKESFRKVKEDVDEKIESVKEFFRGRGADSIPNIDTTNIVPSLSTFTAVPNAIEHDSDSSDSSKGSAESLNHEKVKGKSRKRHSHTNGGTISSITYPGVNGSPVDIVVHQSRGEQIFGSSVDIVVHQSHGEQILGSPVDIVVPQSHGEQIFHNGIQESAANGFSPLQYKIQDQNGSHTRFEEGSTSEYRIVDLVNKTSEIATEIYLEKLYQKQEGHGFYCPNCKTCITKVLIVRERYPEPPPVAPVKGEIICTNCFSFLAPAGNWLRNLFGSKNPDQPSVGTQPGGSIVIPILPERPPPRSSKSWQILKSIVYGGLAEAIASLGIVTSAASADAATLNVLALALANLIGGLFTICHNLWEFKNDVSTVKSEETGEQVDRYQEVLGNKENFFLHAPAAILSFLMFGLVAPVVYGFSFHKSDDKDLKIITAAGASLICITLLAIAKARTQRHPKYIQTVTQYVVVAFGVSGASYAAGNLIEKLMDEFGWFQEHGDNTFLVPQFM